MDGSSSTPNGRFEKIKDFVKGSINLYDVSEGTAHVGLAIFGNKLKTVMSLNKNVSTVKSSIDRIVKLGGVKDIASVLNDIRSELFQFNRNDAKKVIVLVLSGKNVKSANNDLEKKAKLLRRDGINLFVVAIGDDVDQTELVALAGKNENIYQVNNDNDIPDGLGGLERFIGSLTGKMYYQDVLALPNHQFLN